MILERLRDFHARIREDLIPRHHKDQEVAYILEIAENGEFMGITETEDFEIIGPTSYRTSHILPHFPIDKAGFVLGIPKSESEGHRKRAAKMHEAYVELVEKATQKIESPPIDAYLSFLNNAGDKARERATERGVEYGDFLMPRVGRTALRPDLDPQISSFWQDHMDEKLGRRSDFESECLICGEVKPIADLHSKISGLGAQRVGLVLADKEAYRSHGLNKSEVAPICFSCADIFTQALQYLVNNDGHRHRFSDVTWVYWTESETAFDPFEPITKAKPRDIEKLLEAPYKSMPPADIDATPFYAAALTSNISRLAVRSWITTTVGAVKRNVARYFERMRLDGRDGPRYHGLYALAGSTVRELDDLPPHTIETLLTHALRGEQLPMSLLHQAIRRARTEGGITHPRAALLKLVLLSNQSDDTSAMVDETLNRNHDNPAYHCGRLMAVLENIQQTAIPNLNTTLVDRYYGTASTAPASVFGNLMRGAQSHLSKLRRSEDKRGLGHYFQRQIEEIMSQLDGFPRTLSAEDQALFALGYYQQRHHTGASDEAPEPAGSAEAAA